MFLIDTNCLMQMVRSRPDAPQIHALLAVVPRTRLFVSVFTLHSVGVIMRRFGLIGGFIAFIDGLGVGTQVRVVQIELAEFSLIADTCTRLALDFDDAYQYVAADLNGLQLVSLDSDFDGTPNGRLTPAAALQLFTDEQKNRQP
jgi:predicted nucleic acid-binding protein